MNVVMIVLNDMTFDARVRREAATLAAAGHQVDVVCQSGTGLAEVEQVDGFAVRRVSQVGRVSWRRPLRKLAEFRIRERELVRAVAALEPDVVHCHDTPTLVAGSRAARACGAAVVYDAHELYPDSLMQRKYQRAAPVQAYWRRVERRHIPQAHAVITVSPGHRDTLAARFGVDAIVLPNVLPLEPQCEGSPLREQLGIAPHAPVLLYQGALLSVGRSVDELLQVIARIPDAVLVVQGAGAGLDSAKERTAGLGVSDRVHFMGQLDPGDLYRLTCGVDIGTAFIDGITLNHRLTWPNRIFMFMMAGVPIAATDVPGMGGLVTELGIGATAAPTDVDDMERAVRSLLDDPDGRAEMGRRAREAAEREYNWEHVSGRLVSLYDRLAKKAPK